MEKLVDALAAVVRQPLSDPFRAEHIAVSSPGMERWLSMELSRRLGVWANPEFPFPRKLLSVAMSALLGEPAQSASVYEPETMAFALARIIPTMLHEPELAQVAHYLAGDRHAQRRMPLARRMADLFDQYATYRQQEVIAWARGKEEHFQAKLFAALEATYGPSHVAARAEACQALLASTDPHEIRARLRKALPERISVFGVSTLPPLYVRLLAALGEHIDVHLFLLSPSREYYGDVRSHREIDALRRKQEKARNVDLDAWELGAGHPLLASFGRHGRELQTVLEDSNYQELSGDLYEDPGTDTLLHLLQSDLLTLRDRTIEPRQDLPELASSDGSIAFHSCHGPMREVEVLHDQLLSIFADGKVEPHDVIVMTPDIETYAPMIDAVFREASGRPHIAFQIADRGALRTHDVASALDAILDALPSRMGVSRVLDLLGTPVIRARFGLSADDVETARELLAQSGVRWGVDEAHRESVEQPALAENTWRFGMERMALGYAMPAGEDMLFWGRAPAQLDTGDAELVGRVLELCHTLFSLREQLATPCSVAEWAARLRKVLAAMVLNDASTAADHKLCLRALSLLAQRAEQCGFDEPVELAAVREELSTVLDQSAPATGFLAGGVTFCQLMPMRSIPFKVVCLLGLSDGAFPKTDARLSFDRIAQRRRPGDRSRLHDDRQLFLEALLSARERLVITFVGRSIHDGKERPPSVLVSELLDHVERSCRLPKEAGLPAAKRVEHFMKRLCTLHPLQPFSPRNFGADEDPRLFSYARGHCDAARALVATTKQRPAFLAGLQPLLQQRPEQILLTDLEAWLAAPVRWFVRKCLGVPLGQDRDAIEDREPMELNALQLWKVGNDLLLRGAGEEDAAATEAYFRALGELSLGTVGKLQYRELAAQAGALNDALRPHAQGERLADVHVDLDVAGIRLIGTLSDVWAGAQARAQYSRVGGRHELKYFLRHAVCCALSQRDRRAGLPTRSVLVGRPEQGLGASTVTFGALPDPMAWLAEVVKLFVLGQGAPVPLLEHASRAFAEQMRKSGSTDAALADAAKKLEPSGRKGGNDGDDEYVKTVFASFDEVLAVRQPIDFASAATTMYTPLLEHRSST